MDAPRPEARLGHHETVAFLAEQIARRHPHVAQQQLAMAFRRDVVHHRNVAQQLDAGRVERHQDHALLLMSLGVRIGLAHDDQEPAVGMRGVGDEPLASVDHVVVAVAADQRLDVGGVGRRHVRLGHGEGRADLAVQQRLEPALALLRRGEQVQQLHVAGVRRVAVEHFGSPVHAPHDLRQRRVFQVAQPGARLVFAKRWQEQVPQSLLPRQRLQVLHERHGVLAGSDFRVPGADARHDVVVHEGLQLLPQGLHTRAVGEVHGRPLLTGMDAATLVADTANATRLQPLNRPR